jgi:hypothetical protein
VIVPIGGLNRHIRGAAPGRAARCRRHRRGSYRRRPPRGRCGCWASGPSPGSRFRSS